MHVAQLNLHWKGGGGPTIHVFFTLAGCNLALFFFLIGFLAITLQILLYATVPREPRNCSKIRNIQMFNGAGVQYRRLVCEWREEGGEFYEFYFSKCYSRMK